MAEEDKDQKTEYPTARRIQEARDQGQLPISREWGYWMAFVGIVVVVGWFAPPMAEKLITIFRVFLEQPHAFIVDDRGLQALVYATVVQVAKATVWIFIIMTVLIIAGYMTQTGLYASSQLIEPNFNRLSFTNGIKKLLSMGALVELLKSFAKLIVLGSTVLLLLAPIIDDIPAFTGQALMASIDYMHQQALHILIIMLVIYLGIAVADIAYQRYAYIKNLRMTKQEIKDESRTMEGDPLIKQRMARIRIEKARKRMMAQVPRADVVITNPTHYAIALLYESGKMSAPTVLAKGADNIALKIREIAEEHKITLVSNPPLARALYDTVEVDQQIPAQHYRAVAEVISYVYKLKKKAI
jgi:flagellar biosynthetic protein FlhB